MKNFKIIAFAIVACVIAVSCVKDDAENNSTGAYIVGFKNSQSSYIYTDEDTDPVQVTEPIDLVGGSNGTTSNRDITIPFSVDPSSTATAGTDYTINASGSLTLEAGADFVLLPITINPTALPGNDPKTIVIHLGQASSGATVADDKKTITITIAKCASDLAGTYSLVVTRVDDGVVSTFPSEVLTELSLGVYETSTTGPYNDLVDDGAPRNGFIFKDVCQSIQVDEQNLGDYYSNLVEGDENAGSVNLDVNGEVASITINYSIRGFSSGVARRYFTAVYTKL
ncbi:hypothetical protein [Flavobacterium sp.]|uniref:hypothetical protein n=1 Tax=Flavobacterium sp. TaxID=239 RepID=UPI00248A2834|nr:hypothetical protein [Flavobacterium sp.]MDI1318276.1 hypothetical protein [Flavobacterium sp.]